MYHLSSNSVKIRKDHDFCYHLSNVKILKENDLLLSALTYKKIFTINKMALNLLSSTEFSKGKIDSFLTTIAFC